MSSVVAEGHEAVLVALARADVHAPARRIAIGDPQRQPFAEAPPEAEEGEGEHAVAEHPCSLDRCRASSTVTISGRRCPLEGLTRSMLARGLCST